MDGSHPYFFQLGRNGVSGRGTLVEAPSHGCRGAIATGAGGRRGLALANRAGEIVLLQVNPRRDPPRDAPWFAGLIRRMNLDG
jgi:hypothetical protein